MSELSAWFPYEWRPYQKNTFNAISKAYGKRNIKEMMAVLATGLGKRSMAVQISNVPIFHNKPSLFLAHREELINQAIVDFQKCHGFTNVGIIKGKKMELDKKIVVASPQTLVNRLDRIDPDHFGLVQIDEIHNYMAATFLRVVRHFNHDLRIGWTATPYRLDNLSLSNIVEEIVYEYNLADAIKNKFLCELDAIQVKTQVELAGIKKSMGDFNQKELTERVDIPERNRLIVNKYLEYAKGRQFIAFCVTKKHAYNLAEKFKLFGVRVAVIESDTKDRHSIDKAFREKKYDGLININVLTEGYDYSEIGCLIDAAPTTSLTRYLQRIGRVTRLKSDKYVEKFGQNAIILDIIDNSGKHRIVNSWELDKKKDADSKIFVTTEKRDKLKKAEEEREYKLKARNIAADKRIDLLQLPDVRISGSPKMLEEATEKQIQFLKGLGLYDESVEYTKALASEAISNSPAKSWQLKRLRDWGYDISDGATLGQYQKIKNKRDNLTKFDIPEKDIQKIMKKYK